MSLPVYILARGGGGYGSMYCQPTLPMTSDLLVQHLIIGLCGATLLALFFLCLAMVALRRLERERKTHVEALRFARDQGWEGASASWSEFLMRREASWEKSLAEIFADRYSDGYAAGNAHAWETAYDNGLEDGFTQGYQKRQKDEVEEMRERARAQPRAGGKFTKSGDQNATQATNSPDAHRSDDGDLESGL